MPTIHLVIRMFSANL